MPSAEAIIEAKKGEIGMRVVIGADGGGTKTALRAYVPDNGRLRPVGEPVLGLGINYNFIGTDEAVSRFLQGVRAALPPDGELLAVGLGDPACDDQVENEQSRRFREAVEAALGVPLTVRSDVYMALWGLTEGAPGCIVVSGTGSMGIGLDVDGRVYAVGGWGRVTGDEGSGYWIAREGLTAALRAADGLEPPTALLDAALAWAGVREPRELIGYLYPADGEREIAPFASAVAACAASDAAAQGILRKAGMILAGYALRLLDLTGGREAGIGGSVLTKNETVRGAFCRVLDERRPGLRVRVPDRSPEEAAAVCAWNRYQTESKQREE